MTPPDPSAWQMLVALGAVGSVLSLAFLVGYNWRRVTVLEQGFEKHLTWTNDEQKTFRKDFVSRESADLQFAAIKSRLDYLSKQIAEIHTQVLRGHVSE